MVVREVLPSLGDDVILVSLDIDPNESAFKRDVLIANRDPYGAGWLARVRATALEAERGELLAGEEARRAYVRRIDERGLSCMRCADDPVPSA